MRRFELKELIFKIGVEADEIREELRRVQAMPGRELPEAPACLEPMNALRQGLDGALQQLETQERKIREGEHRFSQLQKEVQDHQRMPKPDRHEGISEEIRRAIEDRFAKIEGKLARQQRQTSSWQEDSVRDFQAVEDYFTRVRILRNG